VPDELMPGVRHMLLPEAYQETRIDDDDVVQVIVHSFADGPGATRMRDYLARSDVKVEYTFGVYSDGRIDQWVPVGYAADATIHAKNHSVSIVFESDSTSSSKPFTEAQWAALVRITVWLHQEWGIPLKLIPHGQPTSPGLGWHRMYIEGNKSGLGYASSYDFQGDPSYSWSLSRGKTCPGDARVKQLEAHWVNDVRAALPLPEYLAAMKADWQLVKRITWMRPGKRFRRIRAIAIENLDRFP